MNQQLVNFGADGDSAGKASVMATQHKRHALR